MRKIVSIFNFMWLSIENCNSFYSIISKYTKIAFTRIFSTIHACTWRFTFSSICTCFWKALGRLFYDTRVLISKGPLIAYYTHTAILIGLQNFTMIRMWHVVCMYRWQHIKLNTTVPYEVVIGAILQRKCRAQCAGDCKSKIKTNSTL